MDRWPPLPLDAWRDTRETLHRWAQIVGKIQLALTPTVNHWWNVPLQITARGFGTELLPHDDRVLDLELDFFDDVLRLRVSDGAIRTIALAGSVSSFYAETMAMLHAAGVDVHISPIPVEIADRTPFDRDSRHAYDKEYVLRFWRIASEVTAVLSRFRAGFIGKSSPVQFYWGHLDLSLSRFSGRRASFQTTDPIEREAYSHELFSVGWWAGDDRFPRSAFYFCNATYAAAAELGHWDRADLERDMKGAA